MGSCFALFAAHASISFGARAVSDVTTLPPLYFALVVPLCMCRICTGLLTFSLAATDDLSVVMPDLQDMRKEIDGLDELEREILTQLSVTSASTGVTASHSAPQLHENLESKSSLRERLSLIRMKRSALKDKVKDYQPDLDCCPLKVLGEGGEARILLGKDLSTGGDVAIKVAKRGPHDTLETEFTILNSLRNIKGFPDAIFFSRQKLRGEDVSALVMPLMGTNVLDMWFETTRGRSGLHATTVLDLGAKMLSRLEALHKIGYVHRDIKPNNFLMGGPGGNGPVCLIDMGLAVKWIPFEDPEDEVHDAGQVHHEPGSEKAMTSTPIDWTTIPSTRLDITQGGDDAMFFGTRRYCSMRAHQAKTPLVFPKTALAPPLLFRRQKIVFQTSSPNISTQRWDLSLEP